VSANAYGVSAAHTSVPPDGRLRADRLAAAHLIIAEVHGEPTERLLADVTELGTPVEFICGDGSRVAPGIVCSRFATEDSAASILASRLQDARTGLRVYVAGSERFVRLIVACGVRGGLSEGEMFTETVGSRARRVICMHCKTITEGVTTSVTACAGCRSQLLVYHHFSRRLVAYMGFRVDAEVPGELPEPELLWP
jgi:hypothetical protein